jgi:hypothetical protein
VVTRDVGDFSIVIGSPARRHGHVCQCGLKLRMGRRRSVRCPCGLTYQMRGGRLQLVSGQ